MQQTVVVTIGRNVDGEPMRKEAWHGFKWDVCAAINAVGGTIVQRPRYSEDEDAVGLWVGEDGQTQVETAAAFVGFIRSGAEVGLHQRLDDLRQLYNQDAIGLIVVDGTDHLIK